MKYIIASSVVCETSYKYRFRGEFTKKYPNSKAFVCFGHRDIIFLTPAEKMTDYDELGSMIPPVYASDWHSRLLISALVEEKHYSDEQLKNIKFFPKYPSDKELKKLPCMAITSVKLKDSLWAGLQKKNPKYSLLEVKSLFLTALVARINKGLIEYSQNKTSKHKRLFRFQIFYSYGAGDEIVLISFSNSFLFLAEAVNAMQDLAVDDVLRNPRKTTTPIEHFTWSSSTITSVLWDIPLKITDCVKNILDGDETFCGSVFSTRPGHTNKVIESFKDSVSIGFQEENFQISPGVYNLVYNKQISLYEALQAIEFYLHNANFRDNIRKTCTRIFLKGDKTTSPGDFDLKVKFPLCQKRSKLYWPRFLRVDGLGLTPATNEIFHQFFKHIYRHAEDLAHNNLFSYLSLICRVEVILLRALGDKLKQSGSIENIDEEAIKFIEMLEFCYNDRYLKPGPVVNSHNKPAIAYSGAFQRALMVSDLYANIFIRLQSEAGCVIREEVVDFLPFAITCFGYSAESPELETFHYFRAASIKLRWRLALRPVILLQTLAHETALVLLRIDAPKAFDDLSTFKYSKGKKTLDCPIFNDVLADWISLSTITGISLNSIDNYFRIALSAPDLSNNVKTIYYARTFAHYAVRYFLLNKIVHLADGQSPGIVLAEEIKKIIYPDVIKYFISKLGLSNTFTRTQANVMKDEILFLKSLNTNDIILKPKTIDHAIKKSQDIGKVISDKNISVLMEILKKLYANPDDGEYDFIAALTAFSHCIDPEDFAIPDQIDLDSLMLIQEVEKEIMKKLVEDSPKI